MATTTNYGWTTPDDTALVKDGAAAIRTLGSSVDTTTKALNPSTTLGDIEYRSATANTNTRLAIGTTGQVLTVAGGVPSWATPTSGSGYTQIDSQTMTGSQINFNSISGSYNKLVLVCQDFYAGAINETLKIRFNADSTSNAYKTVGVFDGTSNSGTSTSGWLTWFYAHNTNQSNFVIFEIENYSNTNSWKSGTLSAAYNDGTGDRADISTIAWKNTAAITAINLFISNTTMSGGTAILWGVK
jgi:hypothetical protein